MPTRALTVAATARLKPPPQGQVDHFDRGFPGLALRVSYGGSKAWVYVYRLHGKLRRLTLGRHPAMSWPMLATPGARHARLSARARAHCPGGRCMPTASQPWLRSGSSATKRRTDR